MRRARSLAELTGVPREEDEQRQYFQWLSYVSIRIRSEDALIWQGGIGVYVPLRDHCYAVPNQRGSRSETENKILKGLGVTAGVSDIVVVVPTASYHGLYLELKRQGKTEKDATDAQRDQIRHRLLMGYDARVVAGFEAARAATVGYLSPSWHVTDPFALVKPQPISRTSKPQGAQA